jgi:DNA sulfur modification protein DndB
MSFAEVDRWITRTDQIHDNARLREWIQRELQQERIAEISKYITQQPQHFFNAIVVGIYGGAPEWFPVELQDSLVVGAANIDEAARGTLGLLRLRGAEKVFAIDGQHRVEGIRCALAESPQLAKERLCVLFVAHETSTQGRERTRRLFSTVNRYAKPVSKGEIVALDEDDAFAVVTRRLVDDFVPLTGHRVAFGRQTPVPKNNRSAITTILGLYDIVEIIGRSSTLTSAKELRAFKAKRADDSTLEKIYKQQVEFWSTLAKKAPAVASALSAEAKDEACAVFRTSTGGNLLFRPAGQKAFARAVRVLMDRGTPLSTAVAQLASLPIELSHPPWVGVLWDGASKVMLTKHTVVAQNIFLHFVGEPPDPKGYALADKYRLLAQRDLPPLRRPRPSIAKRK